jgi:hypothetical protein
VNGSALPNSVKLSIYQKRNMRHGSSEKQNEEITNGQNHESIEGGYAKSSHP